MVVSTIGRMQLTHDLPDLIGHRYAPVRLIGRGGMGVVYEVRHTGTDERLALKLILSDVGSAAATRERFKLEARASTRIKSEHVVRVIDADLAPELGGAPYLVMELLEGMDLERAAVASPPSPFTVVGWLRQVARTIDEAHRLGIVHRDLKPENLFLAVEEREGGRREVVKILDFGIVKMLEGAGGLTETGQLLGTPKYMAPEQASTMVAISPATDLCALGFVAYRLLMGKTYYEGGVMVILGQLLNGTLEAPSLRGSPFGAAFDAWFLKACHRDPRERFASASDQVKALAGALGVYGDDDPVPRVRPHGSRKIRVAIAFAVGLGTALVAGAIFWHRGGHGEAAPKASVSEKRTSTPVASILRSTGLWGHGPDDLWVVGESTTPGLGELSHWDGKEWARASGGPFPAIWGIWGTADDLWASADRGKVLHKTNAGWIAGLTPAGTDTALVGIWGSGARDIWAVGAKGTAIHWNGRAWSASATGLPQSLGLIGVWGSSARDFWAVGAAGTIIHWDGRAWLTSPSGVHVDLFDVWGSGPDDVWVVGNAGTVLHWLGSRWSPYEVDAKGDLLGVWGSGPADVWTVGYGGTVVHWNGIFWTGVPSGTIETLYEVWGSGADDVWAVGAAGIVLHWDGKAWSPSHRRL